MSQYTNRYTQFARVRGFELGSASSPPMWEFVLWVKAKWRQWAAQVGRKDLTHLTKGDHAAFDAWLRKEPA
jgi:hypothetical protein